MEGYFNLRKHIYVISEKKFDHLDDIIFESVRERVQLNKRIFSDFNSSKLPNVNKRGKKRNAGDLCTVADKGYGTKLKNEK